MSAEIEITGSGKFEGHRSNITGYSYTEESTPIVPGDDSGGVGALSFQVSKDERDSILLYKDTVNLSDPLYGLVTGFINSVNLNTHAVDISGLSRLGFANTVGTIQPQNTTIGALMVNIFNTASIVGDINVDDSIATEPIVSPGFTGDLWLFLKQICSVYQIEISLIENTIFVRPIRGRSLNTQNVYDESLSIQDITLAQSVDVNYYNYTYEPSFLAYPKGGWTPDVSVYQVDANETVTIDLQLDAYLTSVLQPQVVDLVPVDYTGPNSVYSISGNDGLPIPAALWTDRGGSISLELDDNGRTIRATVVGANLANLAPFTIGVSDGATTYSTLRIRGTGVAFDMETLSVSTGLTEAETPNVVGATIDNPFITTRKQAYDAGVRARLLYALPKRVYEVAGRTLYRPEQSEVGIANTFEDFDDTVGETYTYADFDAEFSALTYADFDERNTRFVAQSFGSVAGSRIRYEEAIYRARTADTSDQGMSVSADFDTIVDDFNTEFAGATFNDFATAFFGLTFNDFSLIPLRTRSSYPFFTLDDDVLGILDKNVLAY